jgi:DNA-3-methyladenine glycosylase I
MPAITKKRCAWAKPGHDLYVEYHDTEWGVRTYDDRRLFEFLLLESAQAGLSWETILKKRSAYREAFAHFDPVKVAKFGRRDIDRLMKESGIVRHRLKIESAISNARLFLDVQKEFGSFSAYLTQFVGQNGPKKITRSITDIPTMTAESEALARDLKARGFKFFGPVIAYAYMQAVGLVNDHTTDCFRYEELEKPQ